MSQKHALVVYGGWDGHDPAGIADYCDGLLRESGFRVTMRPELAPFADGDFMQTVDLVVPIWTMGTISSDELAGVTAAVRAGAGMAGCHGGMCDAFREATEWQFMTGGQWVAHPGDTNVTYEVSFAPGSDHPVTAGLLTATVTSEQYYLHTDPGNTVLATTVFPTPGIDGPHVGNPCQMPQVWVKTYGLGRVFYNAVGHRRADLEPETWRELMRRGFTWASR